jgi:hypothetical protein
MLCQLKVKVEFKSTKVKLKWMLQGGFVKIIVKSNISRMGLLLQIGPYVT